MQPRIVIAAVASAAAIITAVVSIVTYLYSTSSPRAVPLGAPDAHYDDCSLATELRASIAALESDLAACQGLLESTQKREAMGRATLAEVTDSLEDALSVECGPSIARFESTFDWLVSRRGYEAGSHSISRRIAEDARDLGPDGLDLVRARLVSGEPVARSLACAIAEKLGDPELVELLRPVALQDPDERVQKSAARALAATPDAQAVGALVEIVDAAPEFALRLEAWKGIARQHDPAALREFDRLLREAPNPTAAEQLIESAFLVADESVYPALRAAFDEPLVNRELNTRILRILGTSESLQYQSFLDHLTRREDVDPSLKTVAFQSMRG